MQYTSDLKKLILPEYGRNVQQMVDHCMTIEDRAERTRCANTIINIMGNLFPHLRDIDDFKHKLWDHLAIMSDFKLDIDYPFEVIRKDKLDNKPEPVPYPNTKIRYRHYGRTLEILIQKACEFPEGDEKRYNALLDHGLRLVFLVGVPASAGLCLTADALSAFLFQGRSFSPEDVRMTASAVIGYSAGLIGLISIKIAAPAFYARKDIRTPVRAALASLVVVQLVNCAAVPLMGHAGLAFSVGIGSCVNAGTLLLVLRRRRIFEPLASWGSFALRVLFGTAVMSAALWAGQRGIDWTALGWAVRAAGVLGMVAAAAALYFAVLMIFGWRPRDLRP